VREQQQPRRVRIATGDTCNEIRALGDTGEQAARDSFGLEIVAQQLGGTRLVAGRIDRVETHEPAQELGYLVA
jgi:hypothetical protein